MDARLYNKAKAVVEPFAFDRFRKDKIRQEIESERKSRLQIESKLPKVNKELALKIMDEQAFVLARTLALRGCGAAPRGNYCDYFQLVGRCKSVVFFHCFCVLLFCLVSCGHTEQLASQGSHCRDRCLSQPDAIDNRVYR